MSNLELTAKPTIATLRFPGFSRKASPWESDHPIREELFSVERLEAHAKSLAVAQSVASRPTRGLPGPNAQIGALSHSPRALAQPDPREAVEFAKAA